MAETMDVVGDPPISKNEPVQGATSPLSNENHIPAERLVGFGGRMALQSCRGLIANGVMDIQTFVRLFREKHVLKSETCEPMLALMDLGGLSRSRVERMIMAVLTEYFKRKIPELSQKQLQELLDKSYSFLTVPELKPIAISVLERLEDVEKTTWEEIANNGLEESPYVDMPITVKRRIWMALHKTFEHEVDKALKQVIDHSDPERVDDYMIHVDRVKARQDNKVLAHFLYLLGNNDELLVQLIDRLTDLAATEQNVAKRIGIANLFHDIMCSVKKRSMVNVEKLRGMAHYLDVGRENQAMELGQLREVRDALSMNASCGPVTLLVSSVYTRDLVTEQLVNRLIESKKLPATEVDAATALQAFGGVLQRDQILDNLTYICLSNIRAQRILSKNNPLDTTETASYFKDFFPRLCNEIALDDAEFLDNYHTKNAGALDAVFLHAAKQSTFERRILTGYGLMLYARNNVIGLSKLRLVFDHCYSAANPTEETREVAIAQGLVMAVTEW